MKVRFQQNHVGAAAIDVDINVDTDVDVGAENYQSCDCVKSLILIQKLLMVFLLPMHLSPILPLVSQSWEGLWVPLVRHTIYSMESLGRF